MTILTGKAQQEKKENEMNKAKIAGVVVEGPHGVGMRAPSVAWSEPETTPEMYMLYRRKRMLRSLCAGLLILWILLAGILGGILLFNYFHRKPIFVGWCGTSYVEEPASYQGLSFHHGNAKPHFEKLQERVEVDPNEDYEKIEVPKFGPNRPSVFVHDFRTNLTAVVDVLSETCFIKPLDRDQVKMPKNFIDLIQKMDSGYYDKQPELIHETYRIRLPMLSKDEVRDFGSWMIAKECYGRPHVQTPENIPCLRPLLSKDDEVKEKKISPMEGEKKKPVRLLEREPLRKKREAEAAKNFRFFNGDRMIIMNVQD